MEFSASCLPIYFNLIFFFLTEGKSLSRLSSCQIYLILKILTSKFTSWEKYSRKIRIEHKHYWRGKSFHINFRKFLGLGLLLLLFLTKLIGNIIHLNSLLHLKYNALFLHKTLKKQPHQHTLCFSQKNNSRTDARLIFHIGT